MLTSVLALSGVVQAIVDAFTAMALPPLAVIMIFVVMYLFLGMILDGFGMVLLTLPIVYPVVIALGYDPIWFGIVLTMLVEIGLLTPPVGMNCYILKQCHPSVPIAEVFRGVMPFVAMTLTLILISIVWPQFILWPLQ